MSDKAVINGYSIRRTIRVAAPQAKVWRTITEPELIAQWFSETAEFTGSEVGATGVFGWEGHGEFAVLITAVEPETFFEFRWAGAPSLELKDDDSTTVRFSLETDGEQTLITVVESGFDEIAGGTAHRRKRLEENRDGWNIELNELAALLES